jgi:hypothetical protein
MTLEKTEHQNTLDPKKHGSADNDRGHAFAWIWPDVRRLGLSYWTKPMKTHWEMHLTYSTQEEVWVFIEKWLPLCPDPDLLAEAIDQAGRQIPGFLP